MVRCIFEIILAVDFITAISSCASNKISCTHENGWQAESETDHLKSWVDLHHMYEKYAACSSFDDGAIAEGHSDTVGRLLAYDWDTVLQSKEDLRFR